ncbi:MAG: YceI family protein [Bacteroidales bacterium]|jgi:polyisoprenoid-binding protein YceI
MAINRIHLPLLLFFQVLIFPITPVEDNTPPCSHFIRIKGSSNINQFEFVNFNAQLVANTSRSKWDQEILIPTDSFTGPNKYMVNDFQQLLKASRYPYIKIHIKNKQLLTRGDPTGITHSEAVLFIAGVSKKVTIPLTVAECEHSGYIVEGNVELKLTDFQIDPPEKVFGAVQVHDKVFITFAIRFKPEELLTESRQI